MLKKTYQLFKSFGFDPYVFVYSIKGLPHFIKNYFLLKNQIRRSDSSFRVSRIFPILHEIFESAGNARGHYFHMDLFVAQAVYKDNPSRHIDIGSRVDGFVAHVASFREIEVIDFRALKSEISNIKFLQSDLMEDNIIRHNITDSISCLHALEHFGLGRYGDPVNIDGYRIGFCNIAKMLKPLGKFYFAVPIGPQRIEFNAHRVFNLTTLLDLFFKNNLSVLAFSYVDDRGNLHKNIQLTDDLIKANYNCSYGCAIFILQKKEPVY